MLFVKLELKKGRKKKEKLLSDYFKKFCYSHSVCFSQNLQLQRGTVDPKYHLTHSGQAAFCNYRYVWADIDI